METANYSLKHAAELLRGLEAHSEEAEIEFWCALRRRYRGYFAAALPNDDGEALGDLAVRMLQAVDDGDIRRPESFWSFAQTVAYRVLQRHLRDGYARRERDTVQLELLGDMIPDPTPNPEEQLIAGERREYPLALLGAAVAHLRADHRDIVARLLDNESTREIREALGLSETLYRVRKCRAIASIRDYVRREGGGEKWPLAA